MGLDQYLHARRYVGAWKHSESEESTLYRTIAEAIGAKGWRCEASPSLTVEMTVAYWRKANQIHAWFVENVQDGKDDCGSYYVDCEQLEKLRDTCKTVLASTKLVAGQGEDGQSVAHLEDGQLMENSSVARELLPAQEGFFFGSYDYDEWYWHDLQSTVEQIDAALAHFGDGWDFQYHASW
jgi:hypothetical protein